VKTGISISEKSWRSVITLCAVISALYIPARIVLPIGDRYLFTFLGWVISLIFTLDFFINIFSRNTIDIKTVDKPAAKFLWYAVDLLSAIPFGAFGSDILHTIRLLKLARVVQFMHEWKHHQIKFSDYLSFSFFFFWFVIISHLLALGWLAQTGTNNSVNPFEAYVTAIYWVIQTLTTVGYGDISPVTSAQKIYTMVVMLFGAGFYGYIIGNVASLLSQQDPAKAHYSKNIERLKAFVKYRKLPVDLRNKINDYYTYVWKRRLGFDESSFLSSLPQALKIETALFLKKDILDKIPIFQKAPNNFKQEVALNFHSIVVSPGDLICREGELGKEMYFIIQGELEVVSDDGKKVFAVLREGNFFGEISLFKNSPRNASVRAVTYSELYILEKKNFEQVLSRFPSIAEQLKTVAEERNEVFK